MANHIEQKFLDQQGYPDEENRAIRFNSLQFQPTIVGSAMVVAVLFQSPVIFLVFSGLLWINVLFPGANLFENFYNLVIASRRNRPKIPPAPGPRRFAQGMAAVLMLLTGISLLQSWMLPAYVLEAFVLVAFGALLFGKFCIGAYVYHLLRGNSSFANATCPWS